MSRSPLKRRLLFVFLILLLPTMLPGLSADDSESAVSAPRRRLPNYFGQIGISDRQREKIYGLQAQYNTRIDVLQAQIDELKAQRDANIEAVLTDAQKRLLEARREDARRAREAHRAATE